jgi:hypothetical protein
MDLIFGDVGNDWLVGGTNRDNLWGGYGDDLLNADDFLDTAGGTNAETDVRSDSFYADFAFGGAGIDVLIGNTSQDRLIDWSGEANTYITPFSPFGEPTLTRQISPGLKEYLYALSKANGADATRGGDAARNGEPYGEIGLVTSADADWGDQNGGPRDPQNGAYKGKRDSTKIAATYTGPVAPLPIPAPLPAIVPRGLASAWRAAPAKKTAPKPARKAKKTAAAASWRPLGVRSGVRR